jgi:arylsulfatase A-like enzyme
VHVENSNNVPETFNPNDTVSGYQGIPVNMTGIAQVMSRGGYRCHMIGKWDAGMATARHTPHGRGYLSSLHYFHHDNDYFSEVAQGAKCHGAIDIFNTTKPAYSFNESYKTGTKTAPLAVYEEHKLQAAALQIINDHPANVSR